MDIETIFLIVQTTALIATLIITSVYVILVYRTLKSNKNLNQQNIFVEVVKQERELRINLNDYREKLDSGKLNKREEEITKFHYDTLLFGYYESLAVYLKKGLINEDETKLFFKESLTELKRHFEESVLFKEKAGEKKKYPGIQWLFKKWKV